jgi:hypothetical protein
VLDHALLGLAMAALWASALRLSSRAAPDGLARILAAAPVALAAAVGEALVLGLLGLGGSSAALSVAALLTWAVSRTVLSAPRVRVSTELVTWWTARSAGERALLGAIGGAGLAWVAWELRHPDFGFDSETYHLPEIVLWVQGGHPGSVKDVLPGIPVGNYPLTGEVTVAWAMGIARSFVPFLLWPWVTLAMTAAAGWGGLRALGVPRLARGLAVGALCSSPWLLGWRSHGAITDPAALAWLVCAAALCVLARERPPLLAPALLAAGLAVGVKTTAVPLAVFMMAVALWTGRARLRAVRGPLAAAAVGAIGVGLVWYARNLISHGSPFWPFVAAPGSDPVPHYIDLAKASFLSRPAATLDRFGHDYVSRFGGGVLLLFGGVIAPLLARGRRVLAAAAVTVGGLLVWMSSPVTGAPQARLLDESVFSTTRYLLPVVAAGAVALALAAKERRRLSLVAGLILLAALVINLVQLFDLGFPAVPGVHVPLIGVAAGALVGLVASRTPSVRIPRLAAPVAAAALAALLAVPAHGFVERYSHQRAIGSHPVTARLVDDPGYRAGSAPLASAPVFIPALAGDELEHRLEGIGRGGDPCPQIVARRRSTWIVAYRHPLLAATVPLPAGRCLPGVRPAFADDNFVAYRPGR